MFTAEEIREEIRAVECENKGVEKIIIQYGTNYTALVVKIYVKKHEEELMTRVAAFETRELWPALTLMFEEEGFVSCRNGFEKIL